MINKSYSTMIEEALRFTKSMKLDISDISLSPISSIEDVCFNYHNELIMKRGYRDTDFILKCSPICLDIHDYLKKDFNIKSIITSGTIYYRGQPYFKETKENIQLLLGTENHQCKFHSWLTIGEYILDPTLMYTLWYIDEQTKIYRFRESNYRRFTCFKSIDNGKYPIAYEPIFLGKNYFEKTKFRSTVIQMP